MRKKLLLISALMLLATALPAQSWLQQIGTKLTTDQIVRNYTDSLEVYKRKLDSLTRVNALLRRESTDGRYYRLFAPATFYHSAASRMLSLNTDRTADGAVAAAVDGALMNIYLRRPDLILNSENRLLAAGGIRDDVDVPVIQNVELSEQVAPAPEVPAVVEPVGVMITKPNFWTFKGDYYLQFLQNFISSNWHKGGESNYSILASLVLEANYNNKQKLKWDNKLEMKLGFQTSKSDTAHRFKTNNDLLRLTSKLGLQAHKKWYYTLQLTAYTQFARGYKSNDPFTYSDFFSPFDLNLGLGMDYTVETKDKRLTGNVNISPVSYNFRYVDRLALSTSYGLDAGKHTLHDIGSNVTVNLTWKLADQITWKTHLYAYTSYKRALIEWENTFELKISRFITSNIYLYPRFDDSGLRDPDLGYLQFLEFCSLGFAYQF